MWIISESILNGDMKHFLYKTESNNQFIARGPSNIGRG